MRTEIHPAARQITWLVIIVGGIGTLIAIFYLVFNLGPGITLPFTRTALDAGWLLIFGLMWLVLGLVMLRWLRPVGVANATIDDKSRQLADLDARLRSLERTVQNMQPRGEPGSRDLDNELGSLATAIQDVHTRLDDLGDVNNRLHDLESQLDRMYVTLQDAHRRIDEIERMRP